MWQWKKRKCHPSEPVGFVAMRHTFHHPALTTCGAALPVGKKYVGVRYLTKELVFFVVDVKTKGQEVFEDSCKYLGLQDTELFGLAFVQDDEYIFIDPNLKISKYAVKGWRTRDFGVDGDRQPLLTLHLRVKHYVDCHLLISEKVARHHYYLQMLENVRNYCQTLSEEKSFLLAALALQADLGNYSELRHKGKYFEILNYFPSWIVNKIGEDFISQNIPALHKDNVGLSRGEAQVGFIREASDVTAPHNLHFYKIKRRKGKLWNVVWLGIKDSGIGIYEQEESRKMKTLLSSFLWCDIAKLHFEKKKFEILSEGSPEYRRFTYYANSEELAKHLLWLCRTTHHFHMSSEARVQELKKLKLDGGKTYREVYVYTDQQDLAWEEKRNPSSRKSNRCNAITGSADVPDSVQEMKSQQAQSNLVDHRQNKYESKITSGCPSSMVKNHSMEVLPINNGGGALLADMKYKSQSVACFSDRFLTSSTIFLQENSTNQLWSPASNSSLSTTPTSTLLSRSSCASCTDSACSSLSLTSGSTVKASCPTTISRHHHMNSNSQWVKCDSFEELSLDSAPIESKSLPHKVCISTFKDSHVRTASLYDASSLCSNTKSQVSKSIKAAHTSQISASNHGQCANLQGTNVEKYIASKRPSGENATITAVCVSKQSNVLHSSKNPHGNRGTEPNTHLYSRTATRIGVSSLNRDQRLPLTLFSNRGKITACGSEPNLYNSLSESANRKDVSNIDGQSRGRVMHMRRPNSRSEMCLSIIGNIIEYPVNISEFQLVNDKLLASSNPNHRLPMKANSVGSSSSVELGSGDFPFIPPPPAYRNSTDDLSERTVNMYSSTSALSTLVSKERSAQQIPRSASDAHRELRNSLSSPPDVLDIQQLRQKSQALDLPLISALCNDRSLLMLPKTVPTCSRQRHLGNKDPLRFARGYSTAPESGNLSEAMCTVPARPLSWHVSSVFPSYSDNPMGNISLYKQNHDILANCNGSEGVSSVRPNLPPTILTSFGKTPEKQPIQPGDLTYKAGDYRSNKIQMIPMKLLAGSIANGKLHQKGSSS